MPAGANLMKCGKGLGAVRQFQLEVWKVAKSSQRESDFKLGQSQAAGNKEKRR
jgi:hypothetical protein